MGDRLAPAAPRHGTGMWLGSREIDTGNYVFFTIENMGKGGNLMGKYGEIHSKWRNYPIQIRYLVTNMGKIGKTMSYFSLQMFRSCNNAWRFGCYDRL